MEHITWYISCIKCNIRKFREVNIPWGKKMDFNTSLLEFFHHKPCLQNIWVIREYKYTQTVLNSRKMTETLNAF